MTKEQKRKKMSGKVTVGDYTISKSVNNKDRVWIEHSSQEGGEFSMKLFEEVIKSFYNKHF